MVGLVCTDDATQATVVYDNGITLALGQHVSCVLTNDDDPIDLAITKTDDGLVQVAGGPAFDYTITVDNLGPRDANTGEPVTVTDQLPVGFDFVSYPTPSCTAAGQTVDLRGRSSRPAGSRRAIRDHGDGQGPPGCGQWRVHQHGVRRHGR